MSGVSTSGVRTSGVSTSGVGISGAGNTGLGTSASPASASDVWKQAGQYDYRKVIRLAAPGGSLRHAWQIIDYVDVHGNQRADLRFEVILSDDVDGASPSLVGFGFDKNGPLSVWPFWLLSGQPTDAPLQLVPARTAEDLKQFALGLQALSTSDWKLLQCLCDLMLSQYAALSRVDRQMMTWLTGLQRFAKLLSTWPATLRFDAVTIQRVVQQGDYSHLSLSLGNVMTPRGIFPGWDFRLATVAADGVFDANPRLEFGRGGGNESVFERWFVESRNAFGENLELRFTKQDQLLDLPLIWHRLTDADRRLMGQLVEQLPQIVARVAEQSASVILQKMGQDGLRIFEGFKQAAFTMRLCWRTQLGTSWEC